MLGLQLTGFTRQGPSPGSVFDQVAATAVAAETAGFDFFSVMDHLMQVPLEGPPDDPMSEPYVLLGAVAARTSRIRLGTLVTGVTYHRPGRLAKAVTTLDVVSNGRAVLGIGAGWFEEEHAAYGYEFPSVRERFERLDETLQICRAMFREPRTTFQGKHYSVTGAFNVPRPVQPSGPPVLIGGAGERRTIPLTVRYADACNWNCGFSELPRKLDVLAARCAEAGRDPADIVKTAHAIVVPGRSHEEAKAARDRVLASRGLSWEDLDRVMRNVVSDRMIVGDADEVGERIRHLFDLGMDGVIVNLPAHAQIPDDLAFAGEVLTSALPQRKETDDAA
ncbi:LLM class F420-dependent oxidoreductase [Actinomadura sp. 1N219]|uniref:LLM class F420-dependent oxidoreductase n=1 Tax=Actinomadura sp. 1N219 TaxID=3375152 RepID=UPI0037B1B009